MSLRLGASLSALAIVPLASGLARSAPAPAEIPFVLEGHNIVIDVEFRPGQRLPFAFDSGLSPGNIVTPDAARRVGIKPEADVGVRDAGGERASAKFSTVASLRIAGLELNAQPFAITSIPRKVIQRPKKGLLAGYIGAPLLADSVLCIDYSLRKLLYWHRYDFQTDNLESVPMQLNHGLPTVSVDIDGVPATLIVDSGADTALTIYIDFAARHDFSHRYNVLDVGAGNGGSGQRFQTILTQAGDVQIGPGAALSNVPMQIIPQGMDPSWGIAGAVGFPVLQQLNPCLDEAGGRFMYRGE
jgi:hypothetical protein